MGSREMGILNYEFSFCLFFFAGVDIHLCNCSTFIRHEGVKTRSPQIIEIHQ